MRNTFSRRIKPIAFEALNDRQRAIFRSISSGPRGKVEGPFHPLLRSPELCERVQALGSFLRYDCSLEKRLREIAILATARHWNQGFEWQVHIAEAKAAGVAEFTISAIAECNDSASIPIDEREIIDFCRQLHRSGKVDDTHYEQVLKRHGEQGVMDLVGLCGYYALLAMVLNVAETGDTDIIA